MTYDRISLPAVALAALALLAPAAALAQANNFDLIIDGKKMGKDTYTLKPAKNGYNLTSRFTVRVPSTDTSPVSLLDLTDDFRLRGDYSYVEGTTQDATNYAHHVSYTINKAGDELTVANYSGEHPITDLVPVKPNVLILTPLDAGTAQVVLDAILAKPSADGLYNVFIADPTGSAGRPGGGGGRKGGGGGAAPAADSPGAAEPANNMYEAKWFKGKDSGGTLDGKPILLHTYLLAYGRSRYIFYADETNNVMVLNAPAMKASYIRANFKLNATPPAGAATTPPPAQ